MMTKKITISGKAARTKSRTHKVLFVNGTPFKSKVVTLKTAYKRKPKCQGKSDIAD